MRCTSHNLRQGPFSSLLRFHSFHQDVRKHYNAESRVWMTYRSGVYDVTDFIARHPGAQNIMLAAGGDVQPFWDIYSVHKGNDQAGFGASLIY